MEEGIYHKGGSQRRYLLVDIPSQEECQIIEGYSMPTNGGLAAGLSARLRRVILSNAAYSTDTRRRWYSKQS